MKTFDNQNLRNVNIIGMYSLSENILIYSDSNKNSINRLDVSTGTTTCLFTEHEKDWKISNARQMKDAAGDLFLVTEWNVNSKDTRMEIGREKGGNFLVEQTIPFDEKAYSSV